MFSADFSQTGDDPDPSKEREEDLPLGSLQTAFRDQLFACLEECAHGRRGLFSNHELAGENAWPEAARLRELAFALQAILAQSGASDPLCEHLLDLCSMHGESDPGEPRLARAFLQYIAAENL